MKRIEDIENLSAEDLRRIGADESIPLPEDLQVRLPRPAARYWSIAAAAAAQLPVPEAFVYPLPRSQISISMLPLSITWRLF